MTFNDNAPIDSRRVSRRRPGRKTAIGGGSAVLVIGLLIASRFLGVDLTPLAGGLTGAQGGGSEQSAPLAECETGKDANSSVDCLLAGAADSLDTYWADAATTVGADYRQTGVVLFTGGTSTGCGDATSAVGPFYCPPDQTIYIDTAFYDDLRDRFGSSGGPLAKMYVLAHEWGHHISNITGQMNGLDRSQTGPNSDSVRLELQADCYAGAWVGAASTIEAAEGITFLQPVTDAQIKDALSAASAVGDDRIQESAGAQVSPESWTHGSSEARQKWFLNGYDGGPTSCDTFAVAQP